MKRFKDDQEWVTIYRAMENGIGYKLDDEGHFLKKDGYAFRVRKKNNHDQWYTELACEVQFTPFCCGVMQFGNFGETSHANVLSNETLLLIWKIIITFSRNSCNKGVITAWFYKPRNELVFKHPVIEKMFKLGGGKRIGKISYNPNSGNHIKGYQYTIV